MAGEESKKIEDILPKISPYYRARKKMLDNKVISDLSEEDHELVYESSSETLEPLYFWILDFSNGYFKKVEKLADNFTSSPGSGHFSELMGKATRMQEEAMKIMQTLGVLVKSVLNIIYDLREFQIRLAHYKSIKSKNKEEREAARLALKQIWLDQVDIKRGNTSIKGMASQFQYVTLIDAFMAADTLEEAKKLDLNERVKRILEARLAEYLEWETRSEKELTKRYNIERAYLKSQVNSLKLYTKWVKPYLTAAKQLEQGSSLSNPELVSAFNTIYLQLSLLGRTPIDFADEVVNRNLPDSFRNKKLARDYWACVLIDFKFRGIPQRAGQHYVFGGKATVSFKAYSLNDDEYKKLKKEMEDKDVEDALKLASGMTDESLTQIKEDIEEFLGETEEQEAQESRDIDPFTALFKGKKKTEAKEEDKEKIPDKIKPDNWMEKLVRKLVIRNSKERCFKVFDVYKKTHGMPSHEDPYEEIWLPTEDAGLKM